MINYNVFQYNREIEVVCLDGNNTTTMNNYLGLQMYDGTHKLHKGIDNTLRFKIKDTDRKKIDLTDKTVIWKMYDRESRENVLFRYCTITNASKGMCSQLFMPQTLLSSRRFLSIRYVHCRRWCRANHLY